MRTYMPLYFSASYFSENYSLISWYASLNSFEYNAVQLKYSKFLFYFFKYNNKLSSIYLRSLSDQTIVHYDCFLVLVYNCFCVLKNLYLFSKTRTDFEKRISIYLMQSIISSEKLTVTWRKSTFKLKVNKE